MSLTESSTPSPRAAEPLIPSGVRKRSVSIGSHKTSISLEEPFWKALKAIATREQIQLRELIAQIDRGRSHENLSSACRLAVLRDLQSQIEVRPQ